MRILALVLRTALLSGTGLLAACGSQSAQEAPPNAGFAARILDDGTKLFTVTLKGPPEDRGSMASIDNDDCFRCRPGERPPPKRARTIDMKGIATALIAENRYCRDGFVVLEQFPQDRSQILRGECRDSADAGDRARFGK